MHDASPDETPRPRHLGLSRRAWLMVGSWLLSAAALGYVLSRLQLSELKKDVAGITWWYMGVAVLVEILPRLLEAVRWQYLLRPLRTHLVRLFQIIYIGTLYSAVLPLSGGDLVRGVIVARQTGGGVTRVLATEVVERIADALAIILAVWITLRGLALPLSLRIARIILEVGVGLTVAAGLALILRREGILTRLVEWIPRNRLLYRLRNVSVEVVEAANRVGFKTMGVATGAALVSVVVNITAYWLMLRAYHLDLTLLHAGALFAIVMVATFLPGTPGNVGSWQFFCTLGLQLFGVSAARAAGFSIIAYVVWTLPPTLMGFVALLSSSFHWSDLRRARRRDTGTRMG